MKAEIEHVLCRCGHEMKWHLDEVGACVGMRLDGPCLCGRYDDEEPDSTVSVTIETEEDA